MNLVGAGIDFHKAYSGSGGPIGEQLMNDPEASLLATSASTIEMKLDFEGTHSANQTLVVVPYDSDGNPIIGGGQQPSDTPTDTNGSESRHSGCALGGGALLPWLASMTLMRRRRRSCGEV